MTNEDGYYGDVYFTAKLRYRVHCHTPDCAPDTMLRVLRNAEYEYDVTDDELLDVLSIDEVHMEPA